MKQLHIRRREFQAFASVILAGVVVISVGPLLRRAGAATFFGPSPYVRLADSPFNGVHFEYFHLESFEDGALNTPRVSANHGSVANPQPAVDSVDEDDGSVDGLGSGGHSWHSNFTTNALIFTFAADALGSLPTHVGIVWTDCSSPTQDNVTFEAFDAAGAALGSRGPLLLGDSDYLGQTTEDRFFGVVEPRGISALKITMQSSRDWEVDHLQYGFAVLPTISKAGSNVVVKWPQSTNNWTLQVADHLSSANWSDATNAPTHLDGYWTVTTGAMGLSKFFRLRKQLD